MGSLALGEVEIAYVRHAGHPVAPVSDDDRRPIVPYTHVMVNYVRVRDDYVFVRNDYTRVKDNYVRVFAAYACVKSVRLNEIIEVLYGFVSRAKSDRLFSKS